MSRADEPTILEPEQFAVTYDEENGFQIIISEVHGEEDLPDGALALIAAGMRLGDDPAFFHELLSWIKGRVDEPPH